MLHNTAPTQFFSGIGSLDFFEQRRTVVIKEINAKSSDDLFSISLEKYADYLYSKYSIEFPEVYYSNRYISSYESSVPASRFPPEFGILDRSNTITIDVIAFHIPFSGDITYLAFKPSSYYLNTIPGIQVRDNELQFEYINFYNDQLKITREFDNDYRIFEQSLERLKIDFKAYNDGLRSFIISSIDARRDALKTKMNFLSSFNVPLKVNISAPRTFTIPSPQLREKIKISEPKTLNREFIPEPSLGYKDYQTILKIIDDVGRNFERMPSIYKGMEEEHLRDHIIMVLDPNFEYGSATGETFNKKGKTDILLRHDSSVAFVAECKFWGGDKGFHRTIDQLLSYLTWRDSKTAIVLFVKNKAIIPVVEKVKLITPKHKYYVTTKGSKSQNWSEHIFHLPSDPNKEIILSILLFHLPI